MCVNLQPNFNFLYRMRRFFHVFSLLAATTYMLTSCLGSNTDEITLYDDAAFTSFTLGTFTRIYHPVSNPDTTYRTTFTGSLYPMTIDHLGQRIFNQDSLPQGTVPRVLCTVGVKNGGYVGLQGLDGDTIFHLFNANDSVDFTTPRKFRVLSSDGTYLRDYTVSLNIAKSEGVSFDWQKTDSVDLLASLDTRRPLMVGGRLVVMGRLNGVTVAVAKGSDGTWQKLPSNIDTQFGADAWQNAVVKDSFVYLFNAPALLRSKDAENWEQTAATVDMSSVKMLFGAASHELFAIGTDGKLKVLRNDSTAWKNEQLDDAESLLPAAGMACVTFPLVTAKSADYVLFAGSTGNAKDTLSCVWRKLSFYTQAPEKSKWVYVSDPDNRRQLPKMGTLTLAYHGVSLLAAGANSTIYESRDQGVSWFKSSSYALPAKALGDSFAITAAADGTLWVVTSTGQVWRGRKY